VAVELLNAFLNVLV